MRLALGLSAACVLVIVVVLSIVQTVKARCAKQDDQTKQDLEENKVRIFSCLCPTSTHATIIKEKNNLTKCNERLLHSGLNMVMESCLEPLAIGPIRKVRLWLALLCLLGTDFLIIAHLGDQFAQSCTEKTGKLKSQFDQ